MIKFEFQYDETDGKVIFELPSDISLPKILDEFERFLKAATYHFDGHLEIVDEETDNEQE